MQHDQEIPDAYVSCAGFSAVMTPVIQANNIVRDDEESIFRAFRVLDKDKKGYLEPNELRDIMTTQGEPFNPQEIEDMLTVRNGAFLLEC